MKFYYALATVTPTPDFAYVESIVSSVETLDLVTPMYQAFEKLSDSDAKYLKATRPELVGTFRHEGVFTPEYRAHVYTVRDGNRITYFFRP